MKPRFKINGQYVTSEQFGNYQPGDDLSALPPPPARGENDWKQLVSENMGIDGTLEQAKAIDRMLGAPDVDYKQVGPNAWNPVFNDRETWNRYLKAHGQVNMTSGKGQHGVDGAMIQRAIARAKSSETP